MTSSSSASIQILGLGIPSSSPLIVGEERKKAVDDGIQAMNTDMNASPYDWEFFDFTPDMSFDSLSSKLKERKWDVVVVGMGLRTIPSLVPFFQRIVNTIQKDVPSAKLAFNGSFHDTSDACKRALEV